MSALQPIVTRMAIHGHVDVEDKSLLPTLRVAIYSANNPVRTVPMPTVAQHLP